MREARVYRSNKREFECCLLDTKEIVTATALGNLMKGDKIVVGDYVLIEGPSANGDYEIHELKKRNNEVFRIIRRENKKKVTASNCDLLVIVTSVHTPAYKRGIIDRFLIRSLQYNIPAVLVFNKMDTHGEGAPDLIFERDRIKALGVECFEISALNPHLKPKFLNKGYSELKDFLANKTSIFVGQSGVGKSHTINSLTQGQFDLRVNKVGRWGKGSHTTTWLEILDFSDFFIIDGPGIRSFSVDDILSIELLSYFPDIEELATKCKFNQCQHIPSIKGCYFQTLDPNNYENQIILSRLESFLKIKEEVSDREEWEKDY